MFYSVMQAESLCDSDPSLIFSLIKEGDMEVVEKVISKDNFDFNILDSESNNVIMYLIKTKNYDLALKYIDKVDVNHQNNDGNTIMHMLASCNYLSVRKIVERVLDDNKILLNLKNNEGETILDKSIKNNYLYTTMKILENEKFNSIDVYSFKNLYETYIKSDKYGSYSKLNNLEVILETMETKNLVPKVKKLLYLIKNNKQLIEDEINTSKTEKLDYIFNRVIMEIVN